MLDVIALRHRRKLVGVYSLHIGAALMAQLYPLATGIAINGALNQNAWMVVWLLACHLMMTVLEVIAKMADTRAFNNIHSQLAAEVVMASRNSSLAASRVAARASLLREYTTFLERDVPTIIVGAFGVLVSLGALLWLAPGIGAVCLALLAPIVVLNFRLARRSALPLRRLNDRLESEVAILETGRPATVRRHLEALAAWRVRLSDDEARTFGVIEGFVILLFCVALWRISETGGPEVGTVYAIFAYIWRFVTSTDDLPRIVQQVEKLRDISQRIARTM